MRKLPHLRFPEFAQLLNADLSYNSPTSAENNRISIADKLLEDAIRDTSDAGERLPTEIERRAGWFFSEDLSDVRIHFSRAVKAANAHACASGNHLFFDPEYWNPETADGINLIGHELAHVLHQRYHLGACAEKHDGLHQLNCPILEEQANQAGYQITRLFTETIDTKSGNGQTLLGLTSFNQAAGLGLQHWIQKQSVGQLNSTLPTEFSSLAAGSIIFFSSKEGNEFHSDRQLAFNRAHQLAGHAVAPPVIAERTYYANNPTDKNYTTNKEGIAVYFTQNRGTGIDMLAALGRYYEYNDTATPANNRLIVEHTVDPRACLIEILTYNPSGLTCRYWRNVPHFHVMGYNDPNNLHHFATITHDVGDHPDNQNLPRKIEGKLPEYPSLGVQPHHIYYKPGAEPAPVEFNAKSKVKFSEFKTAFEESSRRNAPFERASRLYSLCIDTSTHKPFDAGKFKQSTSLLTWP